MSVEANFLSCTSECRNYEQGLCALLFLKTIPAYRSEGGNARNAPICSSDGLVKSSIHKNEYFGLTVCGAAPPVAWPIRTLVATSNT